MKAKIKVIKEVDVKYLRVSAGVRYWEDTEVNGRQDNEGDQIPCRNYDRWEPLIDVDKAQILNWKKGTTANIHYKICDDGTYELLDENKEVVAKKDGYVPDIMSPEENGFGDYIIMKVDADGFIGNWDAEGIEEIINSGEEDD